MPKENKTEKVSTEIDTSNLQSNQVVKNYNEMCLLLGEAQAAGNSKKAQLKNWERYFDFGRKGQQFIIEEVYDTPFPPTPNSNAIYIKTVELLLMHELAHKKEFTYQYTKTNLFRTLGMINNQYQMNKKIVVSDELKDYPDWQISHFYNRTNQKLTEILFSALNSMKRRCLLMYDEQIIIHRANILHIATDGEKKIILTTQKTILDEMGFTKIPFGQMSDFYDKVNQRLKGLYNWDYIYKEYKLIYNQKYIKNDIIIVEKEIREEIYKNRLTLNCDVIDAVNKQADYLYSKNQDGFVNHNEEIFNNLINDGSVTRKEYFVYPEEYIDNQKQISDFLLSIN